MSKSDEVYLKQKLSKPIGGYWDGGIKDTFYWKIEHRNSDTEVSRVGSLEANSFFDVATGKTDRATLGNARRKLVSRAKKDPDITSYFSYVEGKDMPWPY